MFYVILNEELIAPGHDTEREAHEAARDLVDELRERGEVAAYAVTELPALS